ncbi:hypothetical protein CFAM422_006694 [Trichoderma lentiforme]|uniref:DNA2/NAM7 helicase-like C-terminal domain-containing protein n=1 Tax=Trichoderma lentiforme TaxID=1567552 RepID=A0A9P4XEH4_9HYPO|nr:hypothetical protein CFAM422_006694 [Trichoderma lentiforme]
MTKKDRDSDGHHRNRQAQDGTTSALKFFRASGLPIYRLRTQLRMAKNLFDTCHREVYNDVPFNYGKGSDLGNHAIGVNLENYLRAKFPKLAPAGTKCLVDEVTHSKRNPDQVLNALDFLVDMVKTARISAADIAIITPYAANVELINRRRTRPEHEVLSAMPPAATVDSFQSREADIMVVIMGTTEEVGPGFTTDENRLNVMFSRQKSSLLVFGDIALLFIFVIPSLSQLFSFEAVIRYSRLFRVGICQFTPFNPCSDAELQADPRLRDELKTAESKIGLQAQTELLQLVKSSDWSTTRLSVTKALWETFPVGPEDADTQRRFEVDRTASISRAGKLTGAENPNAFRLPGKQSRRRTRPPPS